MSAQENLLRYLGVVGATIALLFVGQAAIRSSLDLSFNEEIHSQPPNAKLVEIRAKEAQALKAADIEKAMEAVGKSRTANKSIAPKASTDLSAMSGWVQAQNFEPYEPNVVAAPAGAQSAAD